MLSLSVKGLEYGYNGEALFEPLDLTCGKGEVTAVLGSNGRGKTSLLHAVTGLLPPISGCVECDGKIGFVPQVFTSHFSYSVMDIVLMGRVREIRLMDMPGREDERIACEALLKLGIEHLAERTYNTLSGGQRQLVLIARALAMQGGILILDEPMASLDLLNQSRVLKLIRLLADEGMNVVFTTHDPTHALLAANNVLLMMPGKKWIYGSTGDVLTEGNLKCAYGLEVKEFSTDRGRAFVPIFEL